MLVRVDSLKSRALLERSNPSYCLRQNDPKSKPKLLLELMFFHQRTLVGGSMLTPKLQKSPHISIFAESLVSWWGQIGITVLILRSAPTAWVFVAKTRYTCHRSAPPEMAEARQERLTHADANIALNQHQRAGRQPNNDNIGKHAHNIYFVYIHLIY